jgi:acyl carrier protein
MDIQSWVVSWFSKNTDVSKEEVVENISQNYFEMGWIDSLQFISFISDIEREFGIHFSNDEFHDRSFATVQGIVGIIERKAKEKISSDQRGDKRGGQ